MNNEDATSIKPFTKAKQNKKKEKRGSHWWFNIFTFQAVISWLFFLSPSQMDNTESIASPVLQQEWNNRLVHTGYVWLRVIRFICGASHTDGVTEICCWLVIGYVLADTGTIFLCWVAEKKTLPQVAIKASRTKYTEIPHKYMWLCIDVWLMDSCEILEM